MTWKLEETEVTAGQDWSKTYCKNIHLEDVAFTYDTQGQIASIEMMVREPKHNAGDKYTHTFTLRRLD